MKTFLVFKHPSLGVEAVKVGFSWPAAFLSVFWMLAKKLWTWAGIWTLAYIVLAFAQDAALKSLSIGMLLFVLAAHLFLGLVPAFQGNEWRVRNLKSRGYELLETAEAKSPDAAIEQVLHREGASSEPGRS
jgi:Protein of unknown function (DUF2628)